jgi:hypothetical protein
MTGGAVLTTPQFEINGSRYKGSKPVLYVREGEYAPFVLLLDDYTACGRVDGKWVCIDRADGEVASGDLPSVLYYFYGGHISKIVERADRIVVYKDDGDIAELSDVL